MQENTNSVNQEIIVYEPYKGMRGHFDRLRWVLRAKATEKEKFNISLKRLLVQDGLAICTDRCRLHIADMNDCPPIPDGLYKIMENSAKRVLLKRVEDEDFPDIWRIFYPNPKNGGRVSIGDRKEDENKYLTNAIIALYETTHGLKFDAGFVKDAMREGDFKIEFHGSDVAVMGNEDAIAVFCAFQG
jgi:hypothetical protein